MQINIRYHCFVGANELQFVSREEFALHLLTRCYAGSMEQSKRVSLIRIFSSSIYSFWEGRRMDETIFKPDPSFQCHLVVKFRYFLPFPPSWQSNYNQHVILLVSDEDYILQFAPPFTRLELLQAQSCPDAISGHVQQL